MALLIVLVVLPTACGDGRSKEAFCSTLTSEQERILSQLEGTTELGKATGDEFASTLLGLGAGIQAIGELSTYFAKLAKVAPPEIQTESEIVADKVSEMIGSPDLSAKGFASALVGGIAISGQLETMNQYALTNCGQGV